MLVYGDPQPQLLRDKYPDLEFTEEKYHLVIPEFEDYENVLFLHPPSEAIPAMGFDSMIIGSPSGPCYR